MAGTPDSTRTEIRTPMRVFVELYSLDNATYEITNTIDVSEHGAQVESKTAWAPDQRVAVRMIRGNVSSQARVVYSQPRVDRTFLVGLELREPTQSWPVGNASTPLFRGE